MPTIDRQNALTARDFHHSDDCAQGVTIGPRGGIAYPRTEEWRRNGATQTWKTRPDEYRIPVKYGIRTYGALTQNDARAWHIGRATECPDGRLADDLATLDDARQTGTLDAITGKDGAMTRDETYTLLPDPDTRYSVAGYRGIAFAWYGDETVPDEDTEWSGYEAPTGRVVMVMVGDDRHHSVDPADCAPLAEDAYCAGCGQVGCHAYG